MTPEYANAPAEGASARSSSCPQTHQNYITPDEFLSKFQKVKRLGDGRYLVICPCHNDRNPSLAVTFKPDGITLLHCFGCGANGLDVCNTLGIEPSVLFPPSDNPRYKKQSRGGFSAWQLLHALEKDVIVIMIAARALARGEILPDSDINYLSDSALRINSALQHMEGKRHG